jgi:mgtE-like transporter
MNFRDFKESIAALILCAFGALITGLVMGHGSGRFLILPALILLIPPSIGLRGNIYASLGSRLSSYLHTGKITPEFTISKRIASNIYSSTFLLLIFSFLSGILAAQIAYFMNLTTINSKPVTFQELMVDLMLISTMAAFFSAILMIPFTLALSIGSYRWGWNPDNITAPFITLLGDMVTLPLLFVSADMILKMSFLTKIFIYGVVFILTFTFFILSRKTEKGIIGERIVKESFPVLFFCTILDFGAGIILGSNLESFVVLAGLLIIIPAFLEDGGAIGGILSARFSSMLHLGLLYPRLRPPKEVLWSFGIMHVVALIVFLIIGLFGQIINHLLLLPTISTTKMILLTVISGQILMLILDLMSYYFAILSFRKNFDPDNIGIPLITSSADILGVACLVFTLMLFKIV